MTGTDFATADSTRQRLILRKPNGNSKLRQTILVDMNNKRQFSAFRSILSFLPAMITVFVRCFKKKFIAAPYSLSLEEALQKARSSSSLIYSMGIFDKRNKNRNPGVLKDLAAISGGKVFLPKSAADLPEICRRIAADVRSQYTLGYLPANQDADCGFRNIRVDVRASRQNKWTVRTRSGYSCGKNRK